MEQEEKEEKSSTGEENRGEEQHRSRAGFGSLSKIICRGTKKREDALCLSKIACRRSQAREDALCLSKIICRAREDALCLSKIICRGPRSYGRPLVLI